MQLSAYRLETVGDIKTKIQEIQGIPVHQQKLIVARRELQDDHGIPTYRDSVIYLVLPENGGQYKIKTICQFVQLCMCPPHPHTHTCVQFMLG